MSAFISWKCRILLYIIIILSFGLFSSALQKNKNLPVCDVPLKDIEISKENDEVSNEIEVSTDLSEEAVTHFPIAITEKATNSSEDVESKEIAPSQEIQESEEKSASKEKIMFRVVGGQKKKTGAFSYFAKLLLQKATTRRQGYRIKITYFLCAGSIISRQWVLSSAGCVTGLSRGYVEVGLGNPQSKLRYKVKESHAHPSYTDNNPFPHNIGLVCLQKFIEFNFFVQPIKLPMYNFNLYEYPVLIVGYGHKDLMVNTSTTQTVHHICAKIMDIETCRVHSKHNLAKTQLCVFHEPGERICNGDWGGPVIADGVQIAINSYIRNNCSEIQPDGFTRIWPLMKWIEERMGAPFMTGAPDRDKANLGCQIN